MSVFKLPISLDNDFNSMMGRFYWSNSPTGRLLLQMSWKKLLGGIGFRNMESFNPALLAAGKFSKTRTRLSRLAIFPLLFSWKQLTKRRKFLSFCLRWRIGDGSKVNVWRAKWIPSPLSLKVISPSSPALSLRISSISRIFWKS